MCSAMSFLGILSVIGALLRGTLGTYYDVTTLVKLDELSPGVIGNNGTNIIVARGNGRGLPLRKDNTLIDALYGGLPCCQSWTRDGWFSLDSETALSMEPPLDPQLLPIGFDNSTSTFKNEDKCVNSSRCIAPAPVWVLGPTLGHLRSPSLPASVTKANVCVIIVARITTGSRISVVIQHSGGPARFQMGVLTGSEDNTRWIIKRMVKTIPKPLRQKPLDIVLTATQTEGHPVMVQRVASCNPEGDEDVYTVIERAGKAPSLSSGFSVMVPSLNLQSSPVCKNGGLLDVSTSECLCAPGFSGGRCDQGCGPDAFGADCTGKCSSIFLGQQCGGLMLCGAGGTCDCAPGFQGPQCMDLCKPGHYGVGCRESCGNCRNGVACDPFTGRCDRGCQGVIHPPSCMRANIITWFN